MSRSELHVKKRKKGRGPWDRHVKKPDERMAKAQRMCQVDSGIR